MTTMSGNNLAAPITMPPLAPLADPKVEALKAMFPDIEADVLAQLLSFNDGDVERAIETLLETTAAPAESGVTTAAAQVEFDEHLAREVQMELDNAVAQAVQQELTAEMRAEEERRRQNELSTRAMNSASAASKRLIESAKAAKSSFMRPLSARTKKDHGARLLDGGEGPSDAEPMSTVSPLSPLYLPPPPQYNAATPIDTSSTRDLSAPLSLPPAPPAVTPLAVTPLDASSLRPLPTAQSSEEKYTSRVDRARAANCASGRLSSAAPLERPVVATLVTTQPEGSVHVPEGELI